MSDNEICEFDTKKMTVQPADYSLRRFGIDRPVVGRGRVTGEMFQFLDAEDSCLKVVSNDYHSLRSSRPNFVDLAVGVPVEIGRSPRASGKVFDHTEYMSWRAFELLFDGSRVRITNYAPINKTLLTGDLIGQEVSRYDAGRRQKQPNGEIFAGYTAGVVEMFSDRRTTAEAPYGYLEGTSYPIIGRNSPTVKGGVYLTTNSAAILVDHQAPSLQTAQKHVLSMVQYLYRTNGDATSIQDVLDAVNQFTRVRLPYTRDTGAFDRMLNQFRDAQRIIRLSELDEAYCGHQNLDAALWLEALREAWYLVGRSGVERNHNKGDDYGHGWAFFDPAGNTRPENVWVIDPAQNFVGTKAQAAKRGRHNYMLSDIY